MNPGNRGWGVAGSNPASKVYPCCNSIGQSPANPYDIFGNRSTGRAYKCAGERTHQLTKFANRFFMRSDPRVTPADPRDLDRDALREDIKTARDRILARLHHWDIAVCADMVRGSGARGPYYAKMLLRACRDLDRFDSDQRIDAGITRMLQIVLRADDVVERARMRRAREADRNGEDEVEIRGSCGSDAHPDQPRTKSSLPYDRYRKIAS